MKISAINPTYNAEAFIHKAVDSRLQFAEVKEVLLIAYGSVHGSAICKYFEKLA